MTIGAVRALPASAVASRRSRSSAAGFTLLELLAVLVIIGIMVTFASLSIGNRALDDRLEGEAKRLEQLLRLAEDEADLKGLPIGLVITTEGYRFLAPDSARQWTDYAQTGVLRSRPLLQPFYAELRLEGRLIPPVAADVFSEAPAAESGTGAEAGADSADPAVATSDAPANGDEAADNPRRPQVLLLPGGQMTPFTLDLKAPNYPDYFRIEGDLLGRVTRQRRTLGKDAKS